MKGALTVENAVDPASNAIITAWHLRDWIWQY
jgi:hypothetical protein